MDKNFGVMGYECRDSALSASSAHLCVIPVYFLWITFVDSPPCNGLVAVAPLFPENPDDVGETAQAVAAKCGLGVEGATFFEGGSSIS
jgi:hypothetical protein